jgi:hypothetical protein
VEYLYSIYTKLVASETYFFVKKIMTFPEFQGTANVQVGFGMHTNFEKACDISGIAVNDIACRKRLLAELEQRNLPVIPKRKIVLQTSTPQKNTEKQSIQFTDMVNRWVTERGVEALN